MNFFRVTRGRRELPSLLLLMFFFFLSKTAATECPIPTLAFEVVFSPESQLLDDFTEGVEMRLLCAKGYELVSGTGIMTCRNGTWTKPDIACKKKDCGAPVKEPYMIFETPKNTLLGASVKVSCEKGYKQTGLPKMDCFAFGWMNFARCEIVSCKHPPEILNGKSLWTGSQPPKYGEVVSYLCKEGYKLVGEQNITCNEKREYYPKPPVCKMSLCPVPTLAHDMVFSSESQLLNIYTNGVELKMLCANAYEPVSGTGVIKCVSGTWTNLDLKCKLSECPVPTLAHDMVFSPESQLLNIYTNGVELKMLCANEYEPVSGTGVIKCVSGTWTNLDLKCKQKDCGTPKMKPHVVLDSPMNTSIGVTLNVSCKKGYKLSGSGTLTCSLTGWITEAECTIISCKKPPAIPYGKSLWMSAKPPQYRQVVSYFCERGYKLVGLKNITCNESGEYNGKPPVCTGTPTEARKSTVTTSSSSAAAFSTKVGALRKANDTLIIQQDNRNVKAEDKANTESVLGIVSAVSLLLVGTLIVLFIYKFHMKRIGRTVATATQTE